MYDYAAADDDEVSFAEDDFIIHCEPIDDGWMMGTVEKTGQHGMLPSNYVEHVNWWAALQNFKVESWVAKVWDYAVYLFENQCRKLF